MQSKGMVIVQVSGARAIEAFRDEPGGHRWQRVPPTEKRGRVHTSTITVAVLPVPPSGSFTLKEEELKWTACRGSGNGGQKRNVTDSAVQMVHLPTGLAVRCESERSQTHNLRLAKELLRARLAEREAEKRQSQRNQRRRDQVGSGMRGDKRRTIRLQAGKVIDHVTGKTLPARRYLRGEVDGLSSGRGR